MNLDLRLRVVFFLNHGLLHRRLLGFSLLRLNLGVLELLAGIGVVRHVQVFDFTADALNQIGLHRFLDLAESSFIHEADRLEGQGGVGHAVVEADLGHDGLVRNAALRQLLTERGQSLQGRSRNTHQHRIVDLASRSDSQALGVGASLTLLTIFADMRTPDVLRARRTRLALRFSGVDGRGDTVVGVAQRFGVGAFGVATLVVDLGQLVTGRASLEDNDFQGASRFVVSVGDQGLLVATLQREHLALDGYSRETAATGNDQVIGNAEGFLQKSGEGRGFERNNVRFGHLYLQIEF